MVFVKGLFKAKRCSVFEEDKTKCLEVPIWKLLWCADERVYGYYCNRHMKLVKSFLKHGRRKHSSGRFL